MPQIRLARPADAAALLALQCRLDTQSSFMLLEPGEREQTPERLRDCLKGRALWAVSTWSPRRQTGWPTGWRWRFCQSAGASHTGYVVMGADADAAGRGPGQQAAGRGRSAGTAPGLRRLELTVMADNLRALDLYLRGGVQVKGLRRQALARDRAVVDEYYMGKLLPPQDAGPPA